MTRFVIVSALAALNVAAASFAGIIVVNGVAERDYGKPIAVQNTQTQFGDSNIGQVGFANGSELDGLFAANPGAEGGAPASFVLAGNLESNFNKLEIFIDYKPGGQNKLRGDNPDVDFNGLNRMGDNGGGNGLRFDADFAADLYITVTGGNTGNNQYSSFANLAEIRTDGGGFGTFVGGGGEGANAISNPGLGLTIAVNNSNVRGVTGGDGVAKGTGVNTGIEFSIDVAALQNSIADIAEWGNHPVRIVAFVNGGGHDFASNQFLAGIGGGSNLGEPRNIDLGLIDGNQFVTVFEPASSIPGDLDGDGSVNGADLSILLGSWGACSGCAADLNNDGFVDGADLSILLGGWTG
ncbi:MAG: dockerin type I repeat-containing protein [Phycisphaerae bacterium]|nr:dockerin type I repeat-containing protein [Phycisphaerae bacterium]